MNTDISTLLTRTLQSRADEAAGGVDPARILQLARRRRARRRVAWAAAATAGLLVATAVALAGLPGSRHAASEPARRSTTSVGPSPSVPAPVSPELTFVEGLPVGARVALVPRAERRGGSLVVVTGHHVTTLPTSSRSAFGFTPTPRGAMFMTHGDGFTGGGPDPDMDLDLINANGQLTRLHHGALGGFAVDPAGRELALAEPGMGADDPVRITVSSLSSGAPKGDFREPVGTGLVGRTSRGLLLSRGALWRLLDPASGKHSDLPGVIDAVIVPGDPGQLLVETREGGSRWCLRPMPVTTRSAGAALFCSAGTAASTAAYGLALSPDGRFASVGATVVDREVSGSRPRVFPSALENQMKLWEDPTHVLAQVFVEDPKVGADQGQWVWVRCSAATGACERAPLPSGVDAVNP